jgi:hypothetical protein
MIILDDSRLRVWTTAQGLVRMDAAAIGGLKMSTRAFSVPTNNVAQRPSGTGV